MQLRRRSENSDDEVTRTRTTIREINSAIAAEDVNALRKLAKRRGLVNGSLRRKAWPLLLGMPSPNTRPLPKRLKGPGEGGTSRAGRDVDTIAMDVARCLHHTNKELHDQNRDVVRESLISLLASVVDAETVFYYQGLHEIAGVLLLQVGQNVSYHLLVQLAQGHLRDSTRQTLDAVIESLQLLYSILKAADSVLADHIMATGIEPFFAISWVITWFAHHVSPDLVARLFDLFIASHPLMPVYLYVEGMREVRDKLMQLHTMEDLHTFLVNFNVFESTGVTVDEMARRADALMRAHPPMRLYRRRGIQANHSCTVEARLEGGTWWVPEQPPNSFWEAPVATVLDTVERRRPMIVSTGLSAGVAALAAAVWVISNSHIRESSM